MFAVDVNTRDHRTKNGYGDMVVMSIEDYREKKFLYDIDLKLLEARDQATNTTERLTHDEVMTRMRKIVNDVSGEI